MRPQITFPKSLSRAMNYHEKKVQKGDATLLHAHGFYKLPNEMNFHDKKERFEELMNLNERSQNKLIHISLNFHPSDKEKLTDTFYTHLADEYMNRIGFGNQPYLVYKHEDAGHPHIHVLSTLIKDDGKRIYTQNIAKEKSEPARKVLEEKYDLVPADKKDRQRQEEEYLAITPKKIQAGKSATMRSIANVLDFVVEKFKYTSLNELNAILKLYNVKADRGAENGRIYNTRGLTYAVVNESGRTITKPIKASAFHNQPTLDALEFRFSVNQEKRKPDTRHFRNAIDWAFRSNPETLGELSKVLQKERMSVVVRRNESGRVFGITYVSHQKRAVFNGSDLGKQYSAKGILERLERSRETNLQNETQIAPATARIQKKNDQRKSGMEDGRTGSEKDTKNESGSPVQKDGHAQRYSASQTDQGKETPALSSRIFEQLVGEDYGSNAINKDLITDNKKKKKKGFIKQWEL